MIDSPPPEPSALSTWVDAFTIAGVVFAILLGLVNLYIQRRMTKPRLSVRLAVKHLYGHNPGYALEPQGRHAVVEIHNVGHVPVHVRQFGFEGFPGRFHFRKKHRSIGLPLDLRGIGGDSWPCTLEPFTSCTLKAGLDDMVETLLAPEFKARRRAYVLTQVDDAFFVSRKDTRAFFASLNRIAAERKQEAAKLDAAAEPQEQTA